MPTTASAVSPPSPSSGAPYWARSVASASRHASARHTSASLAAREGCKRLGEVGLQVVGQPLPHRVRLEEPGEQVGPAAKGVSEELARTEKPDQQARCARMSGEGAEEH